MKVQLRKNASMRNMIVDVTNGDETVSYMIDKDPEGKWSFGKIIDMMASHMVWTDLENRWGIISECVGEAIKEFFWRYEDRFAAHESWLDASFDHRNNWSWEFNLAAPRG